MSFDYGLYFLSEENRLTCKYPCLIKNPAIKVDPVKGSTFVVMDKDTTQAKIYEHYLSFFLPAGMLDFFELVWMKTESLTSRMTCSHS